MGNYCLTLAVLLVVLVLPFVAHGQRDYCKDLKFLQDKMRGWKMYTTATKKPSVYVERYVRGDRDSTFIGFVIGEPIIAPGPQKGAFVLFEDSTAFRDEDASVLMVPIGGKYFYSTRIYLDDKSSQVFSSKKIMQYGIGGFTGKLSDTKAKAIPLYIECLRRSKF